MSERNFRSAFMAKSSDVSVGLGILVTGQLNNASMRTHTDFARRIARAAVAQPSCFLRIHADQLKFDAWGSLFDSEQKMGAEKKLSRPIRALPYGVPDAFVLFSFSPSQHLNLDLGKNFIRFFLIFLLSDESILFIRATCSHHHGFRPRVLGRGVIDPVMGD